MRFNEYVGTWNIEIIFLSPSNLFFQQNQSCKDSKEIYRKDKTETYTVS